MNHYIAFLTIIEQGSFTKAAEKLGYTQSGISQLIKSLEQELETILIIRSRSGIQLTPDGEQFYPYIQKIVQTKNALDEKKARLHGLETTVIKIGAIGSIARNALPNWIKQFKQLHPNMQFEILLGDYTDIEMMILNNEVDFGFVNPVVATNVVTKPILQDEFLVCLAANHPLANEQLLTIHHLTEAPYILIKDGAINEAYEYFVQNGCMPNVQYTVSEDQIAICMVEQNLGISIIPSLVLHDHGKQIVTKSLTPNKIRHIHLAYKDYAILPIASRKFIDFLLNHAPI